jgi:hypothetical protein
VLGGADVDALGDVGGDDSLALAVAVAIDAALLELLELALGPVVRHPHPRLKTHTNHIRFNVFYLSSWSSRARFHFKRSNQGCAFFEPRTRPWRIAIRAARGSPSALRSRRIAARR